MDAMFIAHESLNSQHLSRCEAIVCKLDLEKSYNMVDWDFLNFFW